MSSHFKTVAVADVPGDAAAWLKEQEASGWELYVVNERVVVLTRS